ncbi:MAG: TetR/AcrR family transcriptional regulator [Clostridiaceae bacterium]
MTIFTKKAIIESFIKILNEKPLHKITVKDIVEDCGISRNSFYYHFEDLPSLVEELLEGEADRLIEEHGAVDSLEDCLMVAIDFALKNKTAVMHLFNSTSREYYESYLNKIARNIVSEYIENIIGELPVKNEDKESIINYYKWVIVGFVLDWMNSGMSYDVKATARRVCELFEGSTQRAFLRSAGLEKFYNGDCIG